MSIKSIPSASKRMSRLGQVSPSRSSDSIRPVDPGGSLCSHALTRIPQQPLGFSQGQSLKGGHTGQDNGKIQSSWQLYSYYQLIIILSKKRRELDIGLHRETTDSPLSLWKLCQWNSHRKKLSSTSKRESSLSKATNPADVLILDYQAPELSEIPFLLFKPPNL